MSHAPILPAHPVWWRVHQQALQLFRDLAAIQRVRPYLEQGTLAWRRLEREQARIEVAIEELRRSVA